jgi:hypothetical protein
MIPTYSFVVQASLPPLALIKRIVLLEINKHTMAPSKQTLIPLGLFVKNPKVSTTKKHLKLERKANSLPQSTRKKPFVDKKRERRIKEEKAIANGAEGWRRHLQKSGHHDADTFRTNIMFQAYGPAPDPSSIGKYHDDNDTGNQDAIERCEDFST